MDKLSTVLTKIAAQLRYTPTRVADEAAKGLDVWLNKSGNPLEVTKTWMQRLHDDLANLGKVARPRLGIFSLTRKPIITNDRVVQWVKEATDDELEEVIQSLMIHISKLHDIGDAFLVKNEPPGSTNITPLSAESVLSGKYTQEELQQLLILSPLKQDTSLAFGQRGQATVSMHAIEDLFDNPRIESQGKPYENMLREAVRKIVEVDTGGELIKYELESVRHMRAFTTHIKRAVARADLSQVIYAIIGYFNYIHTDEKLKHLGRGEQSVIEPFLDAIKVELEKDLEACVRRILRLNKGQPRIRKPRGILSAPSSKAPLH